MLSIEKYEEKDYESWNGFVDNSNNGTIFHRLDFLDYHNDRFQSNEHHLIWRKKNKIIAVLPLAFFDEKERVAKSPYGASYGGVVVANGLTALEAKEIADTLIAYLSSENISTFKWVNTPGLYYDQPSNYLDFFLLNAGAVRTNADLTSYILVNEDPLVHFSRSARKSYNKGLRSGISVEKSTDMETFYDILIPNRAKFGAAPTHSLEESKWLMEKLPENIHLFLAYKDGVAIAGSLVFLCNEKVLLDFYWAHNEDYQEYRPINFLVHEMTKWCSAKNVKYFDFGTQSVNMEIRDGNSRIKEAFGGTGVFRESYELTING
jgi:hypothetical protein